MKKKKLKRFLAITTALSMVFCTNAFATPINLSNSTESVVTDTLDKVNGTDYFTDETTNVWQDGSITEEARVTVSRTSEFEVTIPKEVVLDGSTGTTTYKVKAKGDIAGDQVLTVTPDADFVLFEAGGKSDVTATITQPDTKYIYTDLQGDGTEYNGNISATLTAGEWSGKFSFNIEFKNNNKEHVHDFANEKTVLNSWTLYESYNAKNEDGKWKMENWKNENENTSEDHWWHYSADVRYKLDVKETTEYNISYNYVGTGGIDLYYGTEETGYNNEIFSNWNGEVTSENKKITLDPGIYYFDVEFNGTDENGYVELEISNLVKYCSICGHSHDYTSEITKEPTCTEEGIRTYTCECGDAYTRTIIATGHNYNSGVITKEPTCTETGIKTYTCQNCGDTYTETITATGHNYIGTLIKEATETENGEMTYNCSQCGDSYTGSVAPSFATMSWAAISNVSEKGKAASTFAVGDEKELKIGSETYHVQILDFNHDDKSDGTGKAGITIGLKEAMTVKHIMNSTATNVGGWRDCEMRTYLNETVYNSLPSDLKTIIKTVDKKSDIGNENTTDLVTTQDKLFLFSTTEVGFGTISHAVFAQGATYKYFYSNTDRVKLKSYLNGELSEWWLRSTDTVASYSFYHVSRSPGFYQSPNAFSSYARYAYGVVFGFSI